jgi:hypothetical protein
MPPYPRHYTESDPEGFYRQQQQVLENQPRLPQQTTTNRTRPDHHQRNKIKTNPTGKSNPRRKNSLLLPLQKPATDPRIRRTHNRPQQPAPAKTVSSKALSLPVKASTFKGIRQALPSKIPTPGKSSLPLCSHRPQINNPNTSITLPPSPNRFIERQHHSKQLPKNSVSKLRKDPGTYYLESTLQPPVFYYSRPEISVQQLGIK